MRIYEFVREHVMPFNAVVFTSVTVAGVLDFLAPKAPYLAWVSYALTCLVLLAMVLEVRAQRPGTSDSAWHVRLLGQLRAPPGPLWRSAAWQVFGIIALLALVLGQASKARADSGGLIAGATPNLRNVQMLLLGLQQDTKRIQMTLDGMSPKVDSIHASVGNLESVLKEPRDHLAEGDYPYLQKHVASGKRLPQDQWSLMLGLNQKRSDRFELLRLYMEHGFDIRQPIPLLNSLLGSRIDDIPTLRNLRKLDAWTNQRTQMQLTGLGLGYLCERMDLLAYATIAEDQPLADWLIQHGLNPQEQHPCVFHDQRWSMSSDSIQAILSGK